MPQLPIGNTNAYESDDESDNLLEEGRQKVRRVWEGFIDFAFQGNVLEIAFGLMCVHFVYLFLSLSLRYLMIADDAQSRVHVHGGHHVVCERYYPPAAVGSAAAE